MSNRIYRVRGPAALVVASLLGIGLVLVATSRYGVGLSPDSAYYVSAARSLLSGKGYLDFDGTLYTNWPPLFPTLLAGLGLVGIEPLHGARLLNAVTFGLIVLASGKLFIRCIRSKAFAVLGILSVLLSFQLLKVSVMAWSEPVFILLVLFFIMYMPSFLKRRSWSSLVLVSAFAALACLQRYVGITLILTGGVLITLCTSNSSLLQRLRYTIIFSAISATPIAFWCLRNYAVTSKAVGRHHFHPESLWKVSHSLIATANVLSTWFLPQTLPFSAKLFFCIVSLVLMTAIAFVLCYRRYRGSCDTVQGQVGSSICFVLVYCSFLIFYSTGVSWDPFHQRSLIPAYVPIMLLVFVGAEYTFKKIGAFFRNRSLVHIIGICLCSLWLMYPLSGISKNLLSYIKDGAGLYSYSTTTWRESPFIQWLRDNPPQGNIYSNAPDAIYLLTGIVARATPDRTFDITEPFRTSLSSSEDTYIAWAHNKAHNYLYDLREIISTLEIEEIATFPDGRIFRVLGIGGPGVCRMHRFWSPVKSRHSYTISESEKDKLIDIYAHVWTYESIAYYAFETDSVPGLVPVYRFWSPVLEAHFYTISESERDKLINIYPHVWTYEGIVFYAYPEGQQPQDTLPVYRFWSGTLETHFYTIDETEKNKLIDNYSHVWTYESVAWYAYE